MKSLHFQQTGLPSRPELQMVPIIASLATSQLSEGSFATHITPLRSYHTIQRVMLTVAY